MTIYTHTNANTYADACANTLNTVYRRIHIYIYINIYKYTYRCTEQERLAGHALHSLWYIYIHIYIYTYIHTYILTYILELYRYIYIHEYTQTHPRIHEYKYVYTWICVYLWRYLYTCVACLYLKTAFRCCSICPWSPVGPCWHSPKCGRSAARLPEAQAGAGTARRFDPFVKHQGLGYINNWDIWKLHINNRIFVLINWDINKKYNRILKTHSASDVSFQVARCFFCPVEELGHVMGFADDPNIKSSMSSAPQRPVHLSLHKAPDGTPHDSQWLCNADPLGISHRDGTQLWIRVDLLIQSGDFHIAMLNDILFYGI